MIVYFQHDRIFYFSWSYTLNFYPLNGDPYQSSKDTKLCCRVNSYSLVIQASDGKIKSRMNSQNLKRNQSHKQFLTVVSEFPFND